MKRFLIVLMSLIPIVSQALPNPYVAPKVWERLVSPQTPTLWILKDSQRIIQVDGKNGGIAFDMVLTVKFDGSNQDEVILRISDSDCKDESGSLRVVNQSFTQLSSSDFDFKVSSLSSVIAHRMCAILDQELAKFSKILNLK